MEPQNRCRGLHGQECCVQATPPQQPHRGVGISQPKLRPNQRHGGDGHHRAGDKNRAQFGDWLAAVNP